MDSTCSVCGNSVSGNYCSNCGQQITKKTARFFGLFLDFFSNFFSVDKSFIGTSRKLLSDPKFIVNNFHQGNKKYYVSPGAFLLYGLTIIAIHSYFFGKQLWGLHLDIEGVAAQYSFWIILLPYLILCSYLTFIRQGFHISKHIISISYLSCVFLFIFIILDYIVISISKELSSLLPMFLFFICIFIWNSVVHSNKGKVGYHILNVGIQILIFIAIIISINFFIQSISTN